jgi:cell wall-associated NlpC family hydrolase
VALAAGVAAAGLMIAGMPLPAGATVAPGTVTLQAEAARLSAAIQAQGQRLGQLAERFDAAVLREHAVAAELVRDRRQAAASAASFAAVRRDLREVAVASYVDGSVPAPAPARLGQAGQDPSLTASYVAIVSAEQHHQMQAYATLGRALRADTARLVMARRADRAAVTSLTASAGRARSAQAADGALLARVKGRLAVLVAADVAAAQRASATKVRAVLAAEGQALPGSPTTAAAPAGAPSTAGPVPTTAPVSTTAPASTAAPVTAPPPVPSPTTVPGPPTATPTTDPPTTATLPSPPTTVTTAPAGTPPPQAPGASAAIAYARAQLGKPYQWGGAGPSSFDCSGLVMMAWLQAGISFPHLAQDQYNLTSREPLADLVPGDLVFFGTPTNVYHVGLYIGGGQMIDAPETGQNVQVDSIYWPGLLGAGRVTSNS